MMSGEARYEALVRALRAEIPGFAIVRKDQSKLHRAIHHVLRVVTFGQMTDYLDGYQTTIGRTVYVTSDWDGWPADECSAAADCAAAFAPSHFGELTLLRFFARAAIRCGNQRTRPDAARRCAPRRSRLHAAEAVARSVTADVSERRSSCILQMAARH